jgi:membrane protein implicated in regulation of membrane protease activity
MDFWWIWILAGIIFAIVEIFTPSFVSLPIGIACIITGLVSLIPAVGASLAIQLVVFAAGIVTLIWASRPLAKRLNANNPKSITNVNALIGKIGKVTMEINNEESTGYVKIGGEEWSARSVTDEVIPKGESVFVQEIDGNKLIVTSMSLIE